MRIILMRHGKPSLLPQKPISSLSFKDWIDSYNTADLCPTSAPTLPSVEVARGCNSIVCSDLKRSIDSASLLGIHEISFIDHKLREMEMPWGRIVGLKMLPDWWSVVFRILWFSGYSKNSESFKEAKLRAGRAALLLESIAEKKESVLFIGHGMLNRYIANALIRSGWKIVKKGGPNYWEFGVFER